MDNKLEHKLAEAFSSGFQSIFVGNLWEWCEQHLQLPTGAYAITGPFNVSISPYLKKPMEAMTDPAIRQVNLACSVQTGKSLIQEVLTPYIVLQEPSPVLRVFPTDVMANTCMQTRILPLLRNQPDTKHLLNLVKYNGKTGVLNLGNQFIKACGTSIGLPCFKASKDRADDSRLLSKAAAAALSLSACLFLRICSSSFAPASIAAFLRSAAALICSTSKAP